MRFLFVVLPDFATMQLSSSGKTSDFQSENACPIQVSRTYLENYMKLVKVLNLTAAVCCGVMAIVMGYSYIVGGEPIAFFLAVVNTFFATLNTECFMRD